MLITPPLVFPRPFPVFLNYASPNSHPKYTPLEVLIQYDLRCQMTTRLRLTVFVNIISVFFFTTLMPPVYLQTFKVFSRNHNDWYVDAKGSPLLMSILLFSSHASRRKTAEEGAKLKWWGRDDLYLHFHNFGLCKEIFGLKFSFHPSKGKKV